MGWLNDFVSNTVGSAKEAVSNTSSAVVSATKMAITDPVAGAALTFGVNPTALPVYQATGITPQQQFAVGVAGGAAAMAAPMVAPSLPAGFSTTLTPTVLGGAVAEQAKKMLTEKEPDKTPIQPAAVVTPQKDNPLVVPALIAGLAIIAKVA